MKPSDLSKIVFASTFALSVATLPLAMPASAQTGSGSGGSTPGTSTGVGGTTSGTGTGSGGANSGTTLSPGNTNSGTITAPDGNPSGTTTAPSGSLSGTTTAPGGTSPEQGVNPARSVTEAERDGFDWDWLGLLGLTGLIGLANLFHKPEQEPVHQR